MKLIDRALGWLSEKGLLFENGGDVWASSYYSNSRSAGTKYLIGSYQSSPGLRRVTNQISNAVATTPIKLYKTTKNGKPVRNITLQMAGYQQRSAIIRELSAKGEAQEITDHPMIDLLHNPNDEMTGLLLRKYTQLYLDIPGEAFWIIDRNKIGKPVGLWVIPPHWITATPTDESEYYTANIGSQSNLKIHKDDIVWFKDVNLSNPRGRGTGLGQSLGDEIETDEYASKFLKTWFQNRAKPEMIISVEGASKPALEDAKRRFEQEHRGYRAAHKTFWTPGKLIIKELQQKFSDMELSLLRKDQRDITNQTFGVPPEIMGIIDNSNRATIDAAMYIFQRAVIMPRLEFFRAELQAKMAPLYDPRLIVGFESPIDADKDRQIEIMKGAPWALTRGEWRKRAGLNDRGDVDNVHYVQAGLLPEQVPKSKGLKKKDLKTSKGMSAEDLAPIVNAVDAKLLAQEVVPAHSEQLQNYGDSVYADDLGMDTSFNLQHPAVYAHMQEFAGNRINWINDTTRQELLATLAIGAEQGESEVELMERVKAYFGDMEDYRAARIARTEGVRSSNFGTYHAYSTSGIVQHKEWVATLDQNTRDEHADLGLREPIKLNDPFVIGGMSAMYPGEFGDPAMDINCRCTIVAVISEDKALDKETYWKAYDRKLTSWENVLQKAIKRGFRKQRDAVLEVMPFYLRG